MTKRRIYKNYRTKKARGQHYWVGRKGIVKSIHRVHPEINEKEALHIIDMTFDGVRSNLKRERRYSQPGFGTFRLLHRRAMPARAGRNPFTGELQKFKARPSQKIIKFRPSTQLKKEIN